MNNKRINGIIYKTTNLINGKWYIGKDEANNPGYLGSGVMLRYAIQKYGIENFTKETLDVATSRLELCELEKKIIEETNAVEDPMSYNLQKGGYGGKPSKLLFSQKEVLELYKLNTSLTQLSVKFNCHRETIWRLLRKLLPNCSIYTKIIMYIHLIEKYQSTKSLM
jgi:hypothetical protein